jgi:hypothetical protein
MYIFGLHIHRWKKIYKREQYTFRGRTCFRTVETGYRKCPECNSIQKYSYDSQGGYWFNVPECEQKILEADMVFTRYGDEEDLGYYLDDDRPE